jgi:hypothetical protein
MPGSASAWAYSAAPVEQVEVVNPKVGVLLELVDCVEYLGLGMAGLIEAGTRQQLLFLRLTMLCGVDDRNKAPAWQVGGGGGCPVAG